MTFKLMILGTASSMPMKNRNLSSAALRYHGEIALLDCAEGTQQQLMRSKFSLMRVNKIMITHWHLDHFMGIYGLLATMQMQNRKEPLTIYGPPSNEIGPKKFIDIIKKTKTSFPFEFKEIKKQGKLYTYKDITVEAVRLKHSVPAFGYVFTQIKPPKFNRAKAIKLGVPEGPMFAKLQAGKSVKLKSGKTIKPAQVLIGGEQKKQVAYYTDSIPYTPAFNKIKGADLLIHETTFTEEDHERAHETMHSTAKKIGQMARAAKIKLLVGTHFSARYHDLKHLEQELLKSHKNSQLAREFDEYDV